jgi:hypothetical protein
MAEKEDKKQDMASLMAAVTKDADDELNKLLKIKALNESKGTSGDLFDKALQAMLVKSLSKDDSSSNILPLLINQANQQQQMMMQMMQLMMQQQQQNTQLLVSMLSDKHKSELNTLKEETDKNDKKWAEVLSYLSNLYEKLSDASSGRKTYDFESLVDEIHKYKELEEKLRMVVGGVPATKLVTEEGKVNVLALIKDLLDKLVPLADRFLTLAEKRKGVQKQAIPPKKEIPIPQPVIEPTEQPKVLEEKKEPEPPPVEKEPEKLTLPEPPPLPEKVPEVPIEVIPSPNQEKKKEEPVKEKTEEQPLVFDEKFEEQLDKEIENEFKEELSALPDEERKQVKEELKEKLKKELSGDVVKIEEGDKGSDIDVDIESDKRDTSK